MSYELGTWYENCIYIDEEQENMDLKMVIIWCTKKTNQIANYHKGQILGLALLKFEIATNEFEMWWNCIGILIMT